MQNVFSIDDAPRDLTRAKGLSWLNSKERATEAAIDGFLSQRITAIARIRAGDKTAVALIAPIQRHRQASDVVGLTFESVNN
ncbi:hypothetical protein [Bradyrhizobium sp. F1.13.3]|uniref:hypothetical protein n=1 Tax=Bradyrhizobium sp. F1.13.3 TaxID=3156351 RepID=UPI003397D7A1